jgi:integrase
VRLALLTGARRAEIGSASGAEIVGDVWRIPGSRTKNSRANTIPLSPFMLTLFPVGRGPEPLFGQGGKGFGGWSKSKARLDGRMKEILAETEEPFLEWHLHDLRRTFATGLQRLGIRQEVTESLLNHVSGKAAGIVGVYQRHDYGPEKLHALAAWEAEVLRIVGAGVAGANVVALRTG